MGAGKSKQSNIMETKILNDTTFNVLNKSENAVAASVIAVQDMSVSGIKAYCNLDVNQKINADIKVLQSFTQKDTQKLINDIMNQVEKEAENKAKQETGFANPFGGGKSEQLNKAKTSITNKLTKNITNETINKLQSKVVLNQKLLVENLVIDPCGISVYKSIGVPPPLELVKECVQGSDCKIGQDMVIKFVAEQIGSKITEIINEDKNAQELRDSLSSSSDQKTEGAGEAVGDAAKGIGDGVSDAARGIGDGIGGAFKGATLPLFASASVACIMILAVAAFALSPSGQKLANKAGSRIR